MYDRGFKLMVVEFIESRKIVAEVAKELGVHNNFLYQWRDKFLKKWKHSSSGNGNKTLTAEELEIERLRKKFREEEVERDIVKKAVGIFSKSDGIGTNL